MNKMPFAKPVFAALLGGSFSLSSLQAQNTFHAPGDLILFLQKEGGNDTVYVGLGSAALLYRGSAAGPTEDRQKLNILNINAELTAAFGAGWASDTNVYAGLCAARSSSTGTGIIDGDQTSTLYASKARASVGTLGVAGSAAWDLTTALPYTASSSAMIAMANTFEVNYTTRAAVSPTGVSTIDNQNPFLAPGIQGTAFSGFAGGVQQVGSATPFGVFGAAGQVEFALDLYRIVPREDSETPGVEVTGTKNIGTYEGTVVIGTDGSVSFLTAQAEIAVEQPENSGLVDNGPEVDFGSTVTGTTGTPKTFFIRNTGSANLTGLAVSATGDTADFEIGALSAVTVAPGGNATFTVAFKPTATGKRSAILQIASNDSDEGVFDIPIGGMATSSAVPEIAVEQTGGAALTDNVSNVAFGDQLVGTTGTAKSFTIRNTGTANLTGVAVTASGAHAGDFVLSAPSTTILPGDFSTFTVAFMPAAAGSRSATLLISSNDADENPFEVALSGNGTIPLVPEIVVEQPEGTPLTDNASAVGFGNQTTNTTSAVKSFTIRNTGNADLTGLALSVAGSAGDFVVGALSAGSLTQGTSATFTVAFRPTVEGLRSATLQIVSNDADESPFEIQLSGNGTAVPVPEIVVEQSDGTGLVDNASTVEFGNQNTGTTSGTRTFVIKNAGNTSLTGLAVTTIGGNPGDFAVGALSADTVAPGDSATFAVAFMPSAAGTRAATLQIASNDADENPFDIPLSGTGVIPPPLPQPEIVVEDSSSDDLLDGTRVLFGVIAAGTSNKPKTFTIKNIGVGVLTGISISKTGSHPGDFQVSRLAKNTLAPRESTTFTVSFKPKTSAKPAASDYRSAEIRIASNDEDENPFNITVGGCSCMPSPEIVVEQPARSKLADGKTPKSFGTVTVGAGRSKVFTIRNTGTANLTGIEVSISGGQAKDFVVSKPKVNKLSPESSTTFKVTFKPTASGPRSSTINIKSDDKDENPFDIRVSGQGAK